MDFQLSEFRLDNRVALLTGAARGIGLGIARAFAAAGCAVAIQDLEENVAQSEADKINASGGRAIALGGDIGDLSLGQRLVGQTRENLGGLDILVNNASIQRQSDWLELSPEEIESQLRADLVAPIILCQAAAPIFRAQKWGRILNIGSIQGLKGNAEMLPYSISKTALESLTKALARSEAAYGVTVNNLAPGYFDTLRNSDDFPDEETKRERGETIVPIGRIGEPRDCAGLALLLCSEAGNYITGQTIYVDGGLAVC